MYEKGKTTRHIADWLNKRGHRTMQWNDWTTDAVVALLRLNDATIRPRDAAEKARALKRAWQSSLRARKARVEKSFQRAYPVAKKHRDKGLTLKQIAVLLNQRHVATPNGKSWHPVNVAALLEWIP